MNLIGTSRRELIGNLVGLFLPFCGSSAPRFDRPAHEPPNGVGPAENLAFDEMASRGPQFTAVSGFSVSTLGFGEGVLDGYSQAAFDREATPGRMASMRDAGFDHVRLAVDPSPALSATSPSELSSRLAVVEYAIKKLIDMGFKVILDVHTGGGSGEHEYTVERITDDYPNGPKWKRFLTVVVEIANVVSRFPTCQVAIEQFNETKMRVGSGWPALAHDIWRNIRSANKNITILVSTAYFSGFGTETEFDARSFDDNTIFVVHSYDPQIFTYQGLSVGPTPTVSRLHWPAIRSDEPKALEGQSSRIQRYLGSYFRGNGCPFGTDGTYFDKLIESLQSWCKTQGVAPSRIFFTEYGCRGDSKASDQDLPGPSIVARSMWFQDITARLRKAGFSRTLWDYGSDKNVWDFCNRWAPDPCLMGAVGQLVPSDQFEAESIALFGRMSRQPGIKRKTHINSVISLLKRSGVWDLIDGFWLFGHYNAAAGYDKADAMLNWKPSQSASACRENGSGSWVENEGYASDGVTGFLDTMLAPCTTEGSVATPSSCGLFVMQAGRGPASGSVGFGNSTSGIAVRAGGLTAGSIGSVKSVDCFVPYSKLVVGVVRTDPNGYSPYVRGSSPQAGENFLERVESPAAHPGSDTLKLGKVKNSFSQRSQLFSCCTATSGLNSAQARDLSTIVAFAVQGLDSMV